MLFQRHCGPISINKAVFSFTKQLAAEKSNKTSNHAQAPKKPCRWVSHLRTSTSTDPKLVTCCVEHSGVRQRCVLFLKLSCTDELCSGASRRSAMCLQRSSNCQLLLINDNRSGSVYIWHNTAFTRMATAPAHC